MTNGLVKGVSLMEIGAKMYAFVADDAELKIIDLTNPSNPILVSNLTPKYAIGDLGVSTMKIRE